MGGFEPEKVRLLYPAPLKNLGLCEPHRERQSRVRQSPHKQDVLYATYHVAVKAMIEDAGALLEVIQTETEVEMQPLNKAAMDEVEQ